MNGVEIGRLTADDWAVLRAVRIAALSDSPAAFGSTLARELSLSEAEWRGRLERGVQLVATHEDVVVGTIGVIRLGDREGGPEIVSMWVAPDARGRGVGDRLVEAVIEITRDAGCTQLHLWFSEGNRYAEALYARHGFVCTGAVQPIRDDDPTRLELAMSRRLSPAAPS